MSTSTAPAAAVHGPSGVASGAPLWLRGPVFTVAALLLGVTAHLAGGGALPDPTVLLLVAVLAAVGASALAREECSLPRICAGVVAVQVVTHVILGTTTMPPMPAAAMPAALSGHPSGVLAGPLMLMAHAVAAVLLAAWLRTGEAAAWRAARRATLRLLGRLRPTVLPVPGPLRPPGPEVVGSTRAQPPLVPAATGRRGPPAA